MKTMFGFLLLLIITSILLPAQLQAQSSNFTLGGQADNDDGEPMMEISVNANGTWAIRKKMPNGAYAIYNYSNPLREIFAIKIGSTVYVSYGEGVILAVSDVDSSIGGDVEYVTKRFSQAHGGNPFHIDLTIIYDRNDPDNITITAEFYLDEIPAGTSVSLAHGFPTYIKGNVRAGAFILPNINDYNGSVGAGFTATTAQVQSLTLVGAVGTGGGVMGFYPIGGRPFDRARSAGTGGPQAFPYVFVDRDYNFNNFYYNTTTANNALFVAYENIPTGETTSISTGLVLDEVWPTTL
ncbi:MAG: hypothetical protein LBI58_04060, partial [Tannerellaceae bacterium]|nr:hypothetical protein [Tannerellaceae bacterium]